MNNVLYVSWGGSGRAASLRAAFRRAAADDAALIYLAILDEETFDDVEDEMGLVLVDELEWLLDAQVNLAKSQIGAEVPVRVLVRQGSLVDRIAEVAATLGSPLILIGAPVPAGAGEAVDGLLAAVKTATGQEPELVDIDGTGGVPA